MLEPVAVRITHEADAPIKRFGLYKLGSDGRPEGLLGRFDTHDEVLDVCGTDRAAVVVEVAQYAFVKVDDFSAMFGPIEGKTRT